MVTLRSKTEESEMLSSSQAKPTRRKPSGARRRRVGETGLSSRMANAIQAHLDDGETYEALQAYKTALARMQQGTDEELRTKVVGPLCKAGSKAVGDFVGKGDMACVKDVSSMVLEHFTRCHVKATEDSVKALMGLSAAFEAHPSTPGSTVERLVGRSLGYYLEEILSWRDLCCWRSVKKC